MSDLEPVTLYSSGTIFWYPFLSEAKSTLNGNKYQKNLPGALGEGGNSSSSSNSNISSIKIQVMSKREEKINSINTT